MSKLEQLIKELCPDGVEYKELKEISLMQRGGAITKKNLIVGDVPVISGGKEPAYYCNKYNRNGETITIAGSGAGAGFVQYWNIPIFVGDAFSVIGIENASTKYLFYYLTNIQEYIYSTKKGSGVPHVYISSIEKVKIPLPPLPVQEEIVRILDTFAELTENLTKELAEEFIMRKQQYEYYRETLFNFENSSIKFVPMGDETIGKFTRGSGLQKKDFTNNGVGCIHYGQIYTYYGTYAMKTKTFVSEEFAKKSRIARHGDLIIATTSENDEDVCKAVAWLGNEGIAISGDACFYTHKLNPKYVAYFFQTEQFQKQKRLFITGTKVRRVNVSALEKILIPLPPLEEQQRIVDILDRFDTLVNDIKIGLPAEIEARQRQYEYYRDKLLTFKK